MTDQYAVIGNPIAQSKSPAIHKTFARQTGQDLGYEAILCAPDQFVATVDRLRAAGYRGINVTVPFKTDAFDYADTLSISAAKCGAVNTLSFDEGVVAGANTDGIGLTRDIEKNIGVKIGGARVLLVGAGGAARGATPALLAAGPAELTIANRTVSRATEIAALFVDTFPISSLALDELFDQEFDIVINATSAGLNAESISIPASCFGRGALAYEMVYGRETPFMRFARANGALVSDGIGMLVEQAAEAFLIWRGVLPDTAVVLRALRVT